MATFAKMVRARAARTDSLRGADRADYTMRVNRQPHGRARPATEIGDSLIMQDARGDGNRCQYQRLRRAGHLRPQSSASFHRDLSSP